MKTMTFAVLAAVSVPRLFAITVEVGDGESEAVKIAAENLRIDIARALVEGKNTVRVTALDAGVVLDRLAVRRL